MSAVALAGARPSLLTIPRLPFQGLVRLFSDVDLDLYDEVHKGFDEVTRPPSVAPCESPIASAAT